MLLLPIMIISSSYTLILWLIHRMSSSESRRKAFATCSSHMIVVLLFFGAAIYTYMLPGSYHTAEQDMRVSTFYTIITPVLNPLIYSFRNKDVTEALKSRMPSGLCFRKAVKGKTQEWPCLFPFLYYSFPSYLSFPLSTGSRISNMNPAITFFFLMHASFLLHHVNFS